MYLVKPLPRNTINCSVRRILLNTYCSPNQLTKTSTPFRIIIQQYNRSMIVRSLTYCITLKL